MSDNLNFLSGGSKLPDDFENKIWKEIDGRRSLANAFGNFLEQITGLITMLLGKK